MEQIHVAVARLKDTFNPVSTRLPSVVLRLAAALAARWHTYGAALQGSAAVSARLSRSGTETGRRYGCRTIFLDDTVYRAAGERAKPFAE